VLLFEVYLPSPLSTPSFVYNLANNALTAARRLSKSDALERRHLANLKEPLSGK
jgi:hypothetical protein